jgi:RNA polymerase sigma factor (TIGR02999 family)
VAADITQLLGRWSQGDRSVEATLIADIYPLLRRLAEAQLRRHGGGFTLQATEIANETYLKLAQQASVDWRNRDHFQAIASTVLRRILIDYLRARSSDKRGQQLTQVDLDTLSEGEAVVFDDSIDWLGLDGLLQELEAEDPLCAKVVELKFYAGMNTEQIAQVMGSSVATVGRQWRYARAWLAERLAPEDLG